MRKEFAKIDVYRGQAHCKENRYKMCLENFQRSEIPSKTTEDSVAAPLSQCTVTTITPSQKGSPPELPEQPTTEKESVATSDGPEQNRTDPTAVNKNHHIPESAVLLVCHISEEPKPSRDTLPVLAQTTVPQLLGDLVERGVARKFYLSIILEHHIHVKALLDTGADITLMSTELLSEITKWKSGTREAFRLQRCELNLQAYSHTGLQLKHVAPIHLTVGPMDLVHPVYISPLNTYPLLIGKDLLNLGSGESQCQTTDIATESWANDQTSTQSSEPDVCSSHEDPFLCSLQVDDPHSGPRRITTEINDQSPIPAELTTDEYDDAVSFTKLNEIITITSSPG
ncbi:NYNRIN-like protein, partial [Clarias magur]